MAPKVIVHIGLQKSGTTFLQHMLYDKRETLAEAGVRYPVPVDWERGKRTVANHEWSSYGLLASEYPWVSERRAALESASWQDVLDQVTAWDGTALLSAEALSVIRSGGVRRLLDALGSRDVEVVVTARGLGRSLPSLWQQHIRNGRSTSFETYLRELAGQRDKGPDHIENDPAAHIWRAFSLGGLVRRWSDAGASRVHVVTTPGRPPDLLWRRFMEAIGQPGLARTPIAEPGDAVAHASLTASETLVIRSVNAAMRDASWTGRRSARLRGLLTERFRARGGRGDKVVIPAAWRSRVAEWSADDLAALPGTPARIVGDLDDLRYDPDRETSSGPTPEETGLAGAEAIVALADLAFQESPVRRRVQGVKRHLLR